MKLLSRLRFWRRRPPASVQPSRWQASTLMPDSRFGASMLGQPSAWVASGMAPDSRWVGLSDEERWRRQLSASRRWAWWGVALGLVLGGLIFAPAQWLARGVQSASNGHLLLAEARGSIWNGSAVPVLTGGPGSRDAATLPGRLHWTLRPDWRGLTLEARQPCCLLGTLRLHLQPGLGGYTLRLQDPAKAAAATASTVSGSSQLGQWPTSWLAGLGTPWNTLQLGGLVQVDSPGITLQSHAGRVRMDGTLTLELRDLSSRMSPLPVLGSYRLQVQGLGNGASGSQMVLDTLSGPLQLRGQGQWSGTGLRFRGEAQAGAGHETALANLLNIIGRRQGALSVLSIG